MKIYKVKKFWSVADYAVFKDDILIVGDKNYYNGLGKKYLLKYAEEIPNADTSEIKDFNEEKIAIAYLNAGYFQYLSFIK